MGRNREGLFEGNGGFIDILKETMEKSVISRRWNNNINIGTRDWMFVSNINQYPSVV